VSRLVDLSKLLSSDELTQTKLADSTGVILDVDTLQVFALNETGMFLVEAMRQGATTRDQLVARLVEEFEVDDAVAGRDLDAFVAELVRHLIERRERRKGARDVTR
jgi:hypothetical protein